MEEADVSLALEPLENLSLQSSNSGLSEDTCWALFGGPPPGTQSKERKRTKTSGDLDREEYFSALETIPGIRKIQTEPAAPEEPIDQEEQIIDTKNGALTLEEEQKLEGRTIPIIPKSVSSKLHVKSERQAGLENKQSLTSKSSQISRINLTKDQSIREDIKLSEISMEGVLIFVNESKKSLPSEKMDVVEVQGSKEIMPVQRLSSSSSKEYRLERERAVTSFFFEQLEEETDLRTCSCCCCVERQLRKNEDKSQTKCCKGCDKYKVKIYECDDEEEQCNNYIILVGFNEENILYCNKKMQTSKIDVYKQTLPPFSNSHCKCLIKPLNLGIEYGFVPPPTCEVPKLPSPPIIHNTVKIKPKFSSASSFPTSMDLGKSNRREHCLGLLKSSKQEFSRRVTVKEVVNQFENKNTGCCHPPVPYNNYNCMKPKVQDTGCFGKSIYEKNEICPCCHHRKGVFVLPKKEKNRCSRVARRNDRRQ